MNNKYAKVVVEGSPISKSNFKLFNVHGRAVLPVNSGKYHDRYALYEEEIAIKAKIQNPNTCIEEATIAVLKVFYKSKKRHPDTNNIPKSIFDGIEKSGIIINDAQIRKLIIEEFYDKENPRFELELFAESIYKVNYSIEKKDIEDKPILYCPPSNSKNKNSHGINIKSLKPKDIINDNALKPNGKTPCSFCNKLFKKEDLISANKGKTFICKSCFKKFF